MNYISNRIKTISSLIKPYQSIADVGCDHGYLIIESFINHNIKFAQAIDNKEGPLLSAVDNIKQFDFHEKVIFSLSDGIKDLDNRVEVLIIAGLGGASIVEILSENSGKLRNVKRLILQPNRNIYEVRKWALLNKWEIINETILEENEIFYEVLVLEKTHDPLFYTEKELMFGPILMQNRGEVFIKKWSAINDNYEKLIDQLDENIEKFKTIKEQTVLIKEIINESKECY